MSNPAYDPLPLHSDHRDDVPYNPYNAPPSPDPRLSSFQTPEMQPLGIEEDDLGAARPRFLGRALQDEGPQPRESYASSSNSYPMAESSQSSVYGLNPQNGQRDTAFYSVNYRDDPNESQVGVNSAAMQSSPYLSEKRAAYTEPRARSRRRMWIIGAAVIAIVAIIAIVVAVYFSVIKPKNSDNDVSGGASKGGDKGGDKSSSAASPSSTGKTGSTLAVTGGDGSKVTMEDGTTFTYSNSFGGHWYWDENDPFNNGAKAQSYTPALNETWNYGVDKIRGVNLGGWLNTEPFIVPALYEKYFNSTPQAVDEWTLSQNMAADTANGGLKQLEEHYKTFITEQDFAEIAGAGLNWVRIPIPYWAIEVWDGEPFLPKTCWTYFLKAIQWARKYGLRINLDLHALPGSENGWNHSGRLGKINFLNGPMGLANAQRSLDYIRIIAEFISQPEYKDVVPMFGIANEPFGPTMGQDNLSRFYLEAYRLVRQASGVGEGNGPYISYHDGFEGLKNWKGYFPNSDRTSLDIHTYMCFTDQSADGYDIRGMAPCTAWAANQNASMSDFGLTVGGEWSLALNDCGLFVNGVGLGTRFEGTYPGTSTKTGDCEPWTDWTKWDDDFKKGVQQFALASMDALQDYFFWTWKIGNSSVTGKVESPAWSYKLGLEQGWIPKDPRSAAGTCGNTSPWQPPLKSWQTGGAGAGQIPASVSSQFAWPPTTISAAGAATLLPSYTPTGTIVTLPGPTFTNADKKTVTGGNGWMNSADNVGMYVPIPTCNYLDPWVGPDAAPPSPLCGGAARRDALPEPVITAAP